MERSVTTRLACLNVLRLAAVGAILLSIGCAAGPTAPVTRSVQSQNAASHDDTPPDAPCDSGWTQIDGRWVCE
jgi:hypothetical protein